MKKILIAITGALVLTPLFAHAEDPRCPTWRSTLTILKQDQETHIRMAGSPDPSLAMTIESLEAQIAALCSVTTTDVPPPPTSDPTPPPVVNPDPTPTLPPPPPSDDPSTPPTTPPTEPPTTPPTTPPTEPPTTPPTTPPTEPPTTPPTEPPVTPPVVPPVTPPVEPPVTPPVDGSACDMKLEQIKAQAAAMEAAHKSRSEIVQFINSQHATLKAMGCAGSDFGHLHKKCQRHDRHNCRFTCTKSDHRNCRHND